MSYGCPEVNKCNGLLKRGERRASTDNTVEATTVKVPGATLYIEVRGSGPVLLCITGAPSDAGMFADLAGRLADRYTVVGRA
jgi:hypothetical protein